MNSGKFKVVGNYLHFNNSPIGVSGYGFRNNSGNIEFKNNGGSWTPIEASASGYSGYSGLQGPQGISGYSGLDGVIGQDGASGYIENVRRILQERNNISR
jgi:hypothetical protein